MKKSFDIITLIGYGGSFLSLFLGLVFAEGGLQNAKLFFEPSALSIAFGGSFFAVVGQFGLEDVLNIPRVVKNIFFFFHVTPREVIASIVRYAEVARREGILALEKNLEEIQEPFQKKALRLAIDGSPPDVIDKVLTQDLESSQERHEKGKKFFMQLSTFAPAIGMLGTIMHLALVLTRLDDPSKVGPAMASALLSTFYGVLACYILYTPVANKLDYRDKEETFVKEIVIKGVTAIQAGDNPRIIEERLMSFLSQRESQKK